MWIDETQDKEFEMKFDFTILEVSIIRQGLNSVWDWYVKKNCPKECLKDMKKYHKWCEIIEQDNMSDLYNIQCIRKKLEKICVTKTIKSNKCNEA